MKTHEMVILAILGGVVVSCNPDDRNQAGTRTSDHRETGGMESKADGEGSRTKIGTNVANDHPTSPAGPKGNEGAETSPSIRKGGIVPKKRSVGTGDEYLRWVSEDHKRSMPLLLLKDLGNIDLRKMEAEAKPVGVHRKDEEIPSALHAYARVLDLNISMIHGIVCLGVFDDGESYVVFHGLEGVSAEQFQVAHFVKKSNGRILDCVGR